MRDPIDLTWLVHAVLRSWGWLLWAFIGGLIWAWWSWSTFDRTPEYTAEQQVHVVDPVAVINDTAELVGVPIHVPPRLPHTVYLPVISSSGTIHNLRETARSEVDAVQLLAYSIEITEEYLSAQAETLTPWIDALLEAGAHPLSFEWGDFVVEVAEPTVTVFVPTYDTFPRSVARVFATVFIVTLIIAIAVLFRRESNEPE